MGPGARVVRPREELHVICDRCSWPIGFGCTCRTDQVNARARFLRAKRRHEEAVARYRLNEHRRRLRAAQDKRRAS